LALAFDKELATGTSKEAKSVRRTGEGADMDPTVNPENASTKRRSVFQELFHSNAPSNSVVGQGQSASKARASSEALQN